MYIGMLVYSATGHTLSVAVQLKDGLSSAGHEVVLERLEAANPARAGVANVALETVPDIRRYDALEFAGDREGSAADVIRMLGMKRVDVG